MKNNMDFIAWLQTQVKKGQLGVRKGDLLRFSEDGLFLSSPRVFREYSEKMWAEVQHDFLLEGLHLNCPVTDSHFQNHKHQVGVLIPYKNLNRILPGLPIPVTVERPSCN